MRNRTTREVYPRSRKPNVRSARTRVVRQDSRPLENPLATLGTLAPGALLLDEYVVRQTLHPHETSHPGLFQCAWLSGPPVIVKIAPTNHPPKAALWSMLPQLDHPNVVRTHKVVERDGLFYEIQEFCEGGSLSGCAGSALIDTDWICGSFIPQINEGLKYLHSRGIVHRDVKPSNLYLRQNDVRGAIVIGDFDISSTLVSDRTSRNTTRMAGTWAYSAPEAFPRFVGEGSGSTASRITRSADYYSLGITIIELMTGTTSLHSCGLPDLYDFYLAGGRVELPEAPARLLLLLKGLLVRNRHERWSSAEVDRWIQGKNLREDMQAVINDQRFSLAKSTKPFELGEFQAADLPTLAEAMASNSEQAKSHLMESDMLTQWIANHDANVAHRIDRTREKYRQQPDLALFRTIMLCDPTRGYEVEGVGSVQSIYELPCLLARESPTERHALSALSDSAIGRLEAWLELKNGGDSKLAARISELRQRPLAVRFEELAYVLNRKLPYSTQVSAFLNLRKAESDWVGGITPKEIVAEAFGPGADWEMGVPNCFRTARDRWQQGSLEAWLRARGLSDLATKASAAVTVVRRNLDESFDIYLRNLDPWAEKPELVFESEQIDLGSIEFGTVAPIAVSFKSAGPGFPMGSIRLDGAPSHLSLDSQQIRSRSGAIAMGVNAPASLASGSKSISFRIVADRGNFWIKEDGVTVLYTLVFPLRQTLLRMAIGGAAGALILGGSRAAVMGWLPRAIDFRHVLTVNDQPVPFVVGTLVCMAAIYGVFRLWLEAYKGMRS